MGNILNITNGDCAVAVMKEADIPGDFMPWQDVLHDGPVPARLSLDELSQVRAEFIISRGWGTPQKIKQAFVDRDNRLKSCDEYEKIILWFEHGLYDQLQLLQILDWFYLNPPRNAKLSIICVDQYLGMLSPGEMKDLLEFEEPITEIHLVLSNSAWSAFRSTTPERWCELLTQVSEFKFCKNSRITY